MMYTGAVAPAPLPSELPRGAWELPMGDPIRVKPKNAWEKLDPISRVNFLKIYTVEHNVKVNDFGYVDKDEEWKLITQFNSHWGIPADKRLQGVTQQTAPNYARPPSNVSQGGYFGQPAASGHHPSWNTSTAPASLNPHPSENVAYNQAAAPQSIAPIAEDTTQGYQVSNHSHGTRDLGETGAGEDTPRLRHSEPYLERPANAKSSSSKEHKSRNPRSPSQSHGGKRKQ